MKNYQPGIYVVLDGDIKYVDYYNGKNWLRWGESHTTILPRVIVLSGPLSIESIEAIGKDETV